MVSLGMPQVEGQRSRGSKDCLFEAEFAAITKNNWADSPLRDFLNDFWADDESCTCKSVARIKRSDLVMFERDLTTDD